jgi:hypothetical protein
MPTKTRKRKQTAVPKRQIICKDALQWLPSQINLSAIVTSIPEMEEVGLTPATYEPFFREATRLCLTSLSSKGYAIFLQTDRKKAGWIDKSYLISDEARKAGFKMMWHKIALRQEPGTSGLFRPTYSHMLCYSKVGKPGKLFPDVIHRGSVTYDNGFGIDAVTAVLDYLKAQGINSVTDPFVGSGTTVALANKLGMTATGVDIDPKQCAKARTLKLV